MNISGFNANVLRSRIIDCLQQPILIQSSESNILIRKILLSSSYQVNGIDLSSTYNRLRSLDLGMYNITGLPSNLLTISKRGILVDVTGDLPPTPVKKEVYKSIVTTDQSRYDCYCTY